MNCEQNGARRSDAPYRIGYCPIQVELIQVDALLDRVRSLHRRGWRLVQIGATRFADEFELTYSFDLNGDLFSLRLRVPAAAPRAPSISSIYGCVVLYENELHDLFGIRDRRHGRGFQRQSLQDRRQVPLRLLLKRRPSKRPLRRRPAPPAPLLQPSS